MVYAKEKIMLGRGQTWKPGTLIVQQRSNKKLKRIYEINYYFILNVREERIHFRYMNTTFEWHPVESERPKIIGPWRTKSVHIVDWEDWFQRSSRWDEIQMFVPKGKTCNLIKKK